MFGRFWKLLDFSRAEFKNVEIVLFLKKNFFLEIVRFVFRMKIIVVAG